MVGIVFLEGIVVGVSECVVGYLDLKEIFVVDGYVEGVLCLL